MLRKKRVKMLVCMVMSVLVFFSFFSSASATETIKKEPVKISNSNDNVDYPVGSYPEPDLSKDDKLYVAPGDSNVNDKEISLSGNPALGWKVQSKTYVSTHYGSFRDGPSGRGPGTITLTSSSTVNRSFTNGITGSFPMGKANIGASIGVTIGEAKTYGTSYSITVPSGYRRQIIFRPKYKKYKVVQAYYAKGSPTGKTATAYVTIFSNWDYSWRNI